MEGGTDFDIKILEYEDKREDHDTSVDKLVYFNIIKLVFN